MGLDIYVGSLTRYYAKDWKTVVQQAAEAQGIPFQMSRPTAKDPVTDKAEIRKTVLGWRSLIEHALGERLRGHLDWDESDGTPYFTDKPDFDGWNALRLLAGALAAGQSLPEKLPADWSKDRTWAAAVRKSPYRHVVEPEVWLPADFDDVFVAKSLGGVQLAFGSSSRLLDQLRDINRATLQASPQDLASWRQTGPQLPLPNMARFGLAVFVELAGRSVGSRLPMVLDY